MQATHDAQKSTRCALGTTQLHARLQIDDRGVESTPQSVNAVVTSLKASEVLVDPLLYVCDTHVDELGEMSRKFSEKVGVGHRLSLIEVLPIEAHVTKY